MPRQMPAEFKSELIGMICKNGRKCFGGEDEKQE
jgi:hypothetical protein